MKHTNDTAAVWNRMLARAQGPPQNPRTNSCTRAVAGVGVAARVLRMAGACSAAVLASLQPPRPHAVALDEWRLFTKFRRQNETAGSTADAASPVAPASD